MGCVHTSPVGNVLELRICQLAARTPIRPPVPFSSGQKPFQTYVGGGRGRVECVAAAARLQSLELSRTPMHLSAVVGICLFALG